MNEALPPSAMALIRNRNCLVNENIYGIVTVRLLDVLVRVAEVTPSSDNKSEGNPPFAAVRGLNFKSIIAQLGFELVNIEFIV